MNFIKLQTCIAVTFLCIVAVQLTPHEAQATPRNVQFCNNSLCTLTITIHTISTTGTVGSWTNTFAPLQSANATQPCNIAITGITIGTVGPITLPTPGSCSFHTIPGCGPIALCTQIIGGNTLKISIW